MEVLSQEKRRLRATERKQSVRAKTTGTIVEEFALADESVVSETAKEDDDSHQPWANYNCLAKATVPEGTTLKVSIAGGFDAQPEYGPAEGDQLRYLREDLSGGVVQFYSPNYPDNELAEDGNWRTLGSIEDLASAPDKLDDRWSDSESYECGCSDDDSGEDTDAIQVPGVAAGSSDRIHAGQGPVSLTAAIETAEEDDCGSESTEILFLDVDQGQSVLVETPEKNILIDAGSTKHTQYNLLENDIEEKLGESATIDKLVITHGHQDHISFVDELIDDEDVDVENVYWNKVVDTGHSKDVRAALDAIRDASRSGDLEYHDTDLEEGNGDVLNTEEVTFEIVNPDDAPDSGDPDANSLAMTVKSHGWEFHLSGDSHDNDAVAGDESVDVVTPMHHGASTKGDNTVDWFQKMDPKYVVIPANNNPTGHPKEEASNDISEVDSVEEVYITGDDGTITFTVTEDTDELNPTTDSAPLSSIENPIHVSAVSQSRSVVVP